MAVKGEGIFCLILLCSLLEVSTRKSFPENFIFGTSTSSYQIEGAWNEGGKGWSMWDYLVRTNREHIKDNSTGDIAANSYNLYKRDVEMLKELGVNAYRFSISWPRILPYGRPDFVNPIGVAYYNALIDELLANDIEPFVTMYHWELPQILSEQGGWLNEECVSWFGSYARVLFENFGDRVKYWLTLNEPYIHCNFGYGYGAHAPRQKSPDVGYYECGRHILLANARAYHIYQEEFRATQGGRLGLVVSIDWPIAATDSKEDSEALQDYIAFRVDHYVNPIFSEQGNYPQRLIDRVSEASFRQGLGASRLRPFTQEQINYIKGTSDFLAINHYTSYLVYRNSSVEGKYLIPSVDDDLYVGSYQDPSWPQGTNSWGREYAPGFYHLLIYMKNKYNNPEIFITENGIATPVGLVDDTRVQYYRNYLDALLDAVAEGVNVKGYFAWTLMDTFEWSSGYTLRFGIYQLDLDDPDRKRIPRKSAFVYKEIIKNKVIDRNYDPDPYEKLYQSHVSNISFVTTYYNDEL